jgi:DNA recombination protein RmuC
LLTAREDLIGQMNVFYPIIIGTLTGGLLVAITFLLVRRGRGADGTLLGKIELLERAQERGERMLREEMARGREEGAVSAKAQREELTKSLESVRSIVDLRLKQLQEDNAAHIEKMRATVDEKLQGTLEKRLG